MSGEGYPNPAYFEKEPAPRFLIACAGRVRLGLPPGHVYRLDTEADYRTLADIRQDFPSTTLKLSASTGLCDVCTADANDYE